MFEIYYKKEYYINLKISLNLLSKMRRQLMALIVQRNFKIEITTTNIVEILLYSKKLFKFYLKKKKIEFHSLIFGIFEILLGGFYKFISRNF